MFAPPTKPKKKPMPAMPPAKAKPPMDDLESPDPVEGKPAMPPADDEAAETPEESGNEEYGAKMLGDMLKPLTDAGLESADAKTLLGKILRGAADCLSGGEGENAGLDGGSPAMPNDDSAY